MERIDLHTHSTYSDGTLTPTELLELAYKKKIKALAISDHDSIDGLAEGREAAKNYNIRFINAIELSAFVDEQEIHILAYFFHDQLEAIAKSLDKIKSQREERNKEMASQFAKHGLDINYNDITNTGNGNVITRAHFAKVLLEKNYVQTFDEAFKKYLSANSPHSVYVERVRMSAKDAISLIRSARGIPVLAHPVRYGLDIRGIESLIIQLSAVGLLGVEAQYSTYNKINELEITNLAKKYKLKITGGSDFHGDIKPHIQLGDGTDKTIIPYSILENLE